MIKRLHRHCIIKNYSNVKEDSFAIKILNEFNGQTTLLMDQICVQFQKSERVILEEIQKDEQSQIVTLYY